ncbi:multivesicular body subunit 12A isoform X1 [Embiotoca jacksoni]|uniref:multivesicular body subunit 12A isoform X1 n=1 Tax=Embiotoca jacksoni TaxID=100190 RepID=UPI0037048503
MTPTDCKLTSLKVPTKKKKKKKKKGCCVKVCFHDSNALNDQRQQAPNMKSTFNTASARVKSRSKPSPARAALFVPRLAVSSACSDPVLRDVTVRPVSSESLCPPQISITEDGAVANFTRSFAMKSGYYLCYSKALTGGMVVTDIQVISEKDSIPHGYCYIAEHLEPKTSVWKKKRVCVRIAPVGSVETAVLDIKLTAKSKMMLQHYTYVGDIHGYVLWCRKGHFLSPVPQAKPRSVGLDVRSLSLEQPSALLPLRPSNPPPPLPNSRLSNRRGSLHSKDNLDKPADSSIQGITALDGVPFSLHPKFDIQENGTLNNIRIKSLRDIENEYSYTFAVEEYAAKRIRPTGGATSSQ